MVFTFFFQASAGGEKDVEGKRPIDRPLGQQGYGRPYRIKKPGVCLGCTCTCMSPLVPLQHSLAPHCIVTFRGSGSQDYIYCVF